MVRVDQDEILVDIGYKSEGVIPISELSIRRNVDPSEEVAVGDEVDALVMQKEDAEGRLILSKKRARFEKAWKRIEAAAESGEAVEGTVIEVVKGGLIIDLGVRGFLPASLVDIRRVQDLDEYLHKTLRCRVIELNRSRNNVVLAAAPCSRRSAARFASASSTRSTSGQVVEGTISNIVDFGAFVDLDGIDGLIHISELSWSHVNHPSEVLEIGQTVRVKVLDIDRDRQRISLGLKQTQADPWQEVLDSYQQGDVVHGRVTKVVTFGAFVEILPGVEGLVHISELAAHHVENPREVVSQGQDVLVKIIEIDAERRRLSLSLKRVAEDDEVQPRIDLGGLMPSARAGRRGRRAVARALRGRLRRGGRRRRREAEAGPRARPTCPTSRSPRSSTPRSTPSWTPWPRSSRPRACPRRPPRRWPRRSSPRPSPRRSSRRPSPRSRGRGRARGARRGGCRGDRRRGRRRGGDRRRAHRRGRARGRRRGGCRGDRREAVAEESPRRSWPRPSPRACPRSRGRCRGDAPRPSRQSSPRKPPRKRPSRKASQASVDRSPLLLGLTGGIGSGKSAALAAFARCGCPTLSSDAVVHELYRTAPVRDAVVARLGAGVLGADGEVDRAALGAVAFADPEVLRFLEGLLHPLVADELERWRAAQAAPGRASSCTRCRCSSRPISRAATTPRCS